MYDISKYNLKKKDKEGIKNDLKKKKSKLDLPEKTVELDILAVPIISSSCCKSDKEDVAKANIKKDDSKDIKGTNKKKRPATDEGCLIV